MDKAEEKAVEVRARINQLITESGVTQNRIAAGSTQAQKRINSQLSHGSAISLDTVIRVLDAFPDISADWLLRGAGTRNSGSNISSGHSVVTAGSNNTVVNGQEKTIPEAFVRDMLAQKDKQIETLLALIGNK